MTRSVVKPKVDAVRPSWKKGVAKTRPHEQKQAARPELGDEHARKCEIQPSPKDSSGRAWRHGSRVHVLTRGELGRESALAVSRGRSSGSLVKASRSEGPKSHERVSIGSLDKQGEKTCETTRSGNCGGYRGGAAERDRWSLTKTNARTSSPEDPRTKMQEENQ